MQVADCEALRRDIKAVAEKMVVLRQAFRPDKVPGGNEAIANATLAYRHLEDASMRLGKAIQALDGGISIYDKTQVTNVLAESEKEAR